MTLEEIMAINVQRCEPTDIIRDVFNRKSEQLGFEERM